MIGIMFQGFRKNLTVALTGKKRMIDYVRTEGYFGAKAMHFSIAICQYGVAIMKVDMLTMIETKML